MAIFRSVADLPASWRGAVAAIGNFDGVHLGHRALIAEAREKAAQAGVKSLVLTFEPHPRRLFVPNAAPFRLDSLGTKARLIAGLGIDGLLALNFDAAFAALSASDFALGMLGRDLGLGHAVVGYDFTFGRGRAGDTAKLESLGREAGFGVSIIAPQMGDKESEPYSSSHIRRLLEAGDVKAANALLTRPWEVEGIVQHGDQRGRTIGFPTANVALGDYLIPKLGVYAVEVHGAADGRPVPGVANIGRRPTFDKETVALEAHLFDFSGDLYGRTLRVAFQGFIRPEQKFSGLDALKAQIAADSAEARRILAA